MKRFWPALLVVASGSLWCGKPGGSDGSASHYRGTIRAADGRSGTPCKVGVSMRLPSGEWLAINTLSASTGGSFEGTARAITPGPVEMPLRLTIKCDGYAELTRELPWSVSPQKRNDLEAGEFVVGGTGPK